MLQYESVLDRLLLVVVEATVVLDHDVVGGDDGLHSVDELQGVAKEAGLVQRQVCNVFQLLQHVDAALDCINFRNVVEVGNGRMCGGMLLFGRREVLF